jgi:ATP-dependent DNA helicase DinG
MIESLDPPRYPNQPNELPAWVTRLRPTQVRAVNQAVEALDRVDLVIIDAPVGSGKTLIGEMIRRELNAGDTVYVCTDKQLQDQVLDDFDYAKVLKGRANYIPTKAGGSITCDDCQLPGQCQWCFDSKTCPYQIAKRQALGARLAVFNTSLFLAGANFAGFYTDRQTQKVVPVDLVIADECDLLEDSLIKFIQFEVPQWVQRMAGVQPPVKGARKPTLIQWLKDWIVLVGGISVPDPKRQRSLDGLLRSAGRVMNDLTRDLERGDGDDEDSGLWVRDYDTETFKMRPVTVNKQAPGLLWRWGSKWVLMSGTVVSAEELVESLGWDREYEVVTVPSTVPVENRRVVAAPIADLTRKAGDRDWPKVVTAIERILKEHEGRVLVHTVSYKLTEYLASTIVTDRPVFSHSNAREKMDALRKYSQTENAVLFSPSCQRGVDLFDDLCRVQVIVKCPFPSLGDKQVSSRLRMPGGDLWYAVKTVRDIVQMTGRGVRSRTDWCQTYVLDQQFTKNIWRRHRRLFVASFVESVDLKQDVRWLL